MVMQAILVYYLVSVNCSNLKQYYDTFLDIRVLIQIFIYSNYYYLITEKMSLPESVVLPMKEMYQPMP